jgi:RNA polymerase sigma-70 factor (ECF subfamily)
MEDIEILRKFIDDDPTAWTKIYEMFYRMVWFRIRRDVSNRADVDELANDVFMKIMGNCNGIDTMNKLKALLRTTAKNVTIDYYRKQQTGKIIKTEEYDSIAESFDSQEINKIYENDELLIQEINKQPKQRKKIILYKLDGYTVKEIAEKLMLSEWTVYNHLKAVKKDLKEKFGDQLKNYGLLMLLVFLWQSLLH